MIWLTMLKAPMSHERLLHWSKFCFWLKTCWLTTDPWGIWIQEMCCLIGCSRTEADSITLIIKSCCQEATGGHQLCIIMKTEMPHTIACICWQVFIDALEFSPQKIWIWIHKQTDLQIITRQAIWHSGGKNFHSCDGVLFHKMFNKCTFGSCLWMLPFKADEEILQGSDLSFSKKDSISKERLNTRSWSTTYLFI